MPNDMTILDGGMGRLLEKMGAPFQQPEWSALSLIEEPEYVTKAHQAFIDAGSDIITTNAYALVPFHIGQDRFDRKGRELIKLSAQIAKNITQGTNVKVAGCLPPAFGSYRPDLFIREKAKEIYKPLIEEQEPYVDLWLAETVSSIEEAEAISELLQKSQKEFWIAYTITDRETHEEIPKLRSGESIQDAVRSAINYNAKAVLFNCSQIEEMQPALEIISSMKINIPYGVYANSFPAIKKEAMANDEIKQLRDDACPENYLKAAKTWKALGASIIGGCCGIGPEHIEALQALR